MRSYNLTQENEIFIFKNCNKMNVYGLSKICNCNPIDIYKFYKTFNLSYKKDKFVLTERETEIMELVSKSYSNKEITKKFFIENSTLKGHLIHCYQKLNVFSKQHKDVSTRVRAVLEYLKLTGRLMINLED